MDFQVYPSAHWIPLPTQATAMNTVLLAGTEPVIDEDEVLPRITQGSPKQIRWATEVREKMRLIFPVAVDKIATDDEMYHILRYFCRALLRTQTDADFWLNARDLLNLWKTNDPAPFGQWFLRAYIGAAHPTKN